MGKYDKITDEKFYDKLEEILGRMNPGDILMIPGVYEVISEALNNDVLDELEEPEEEAVSAATSPVDG
jgi:hypothetical protein